MVYFDFFFAIDSSSLPDLLFIINSLTVADLLFVIEDSRERRQKVGERTGTKRIDQIECEIC
jgi:hypothetical protein